MGRECGLKEGAAKGKPRRGCVCQGLGECSGGAPGRVRARREGRARPAPQAAGPQLTVRFSLSCLPSATRPQRATCPRTGCFCTAPSRASPSGSARPSRPRSCCACGACLREEPLRGGRREAGSSWPAASASPRRPGNEWSALRPGARWRWAGRAPERHP